MFEHKRASQLLWTGALRCNASNTCTDGGMNFTQCHVLMLAAITLRLLKIYH